MHQITHYNHEKKVIHHFSLTQHKNSAPSLNSTWEFHFIGCTENSDYVKCITNNLQRRSISTFQIIRKFDLVKQNTNVFWGNTMSPLPFPTKILNDFILLFHIWFFFNIYVRYGIGKIFHECKILVCALVHISISMSQKADHSDSPSHIRNKHVYI